MVSWTYFTSEHDAALRRSTLIHPYSSGNSTKRDEFINALLSRDTPTTAATESGAIGIGDLLKIFNIGGDIANGVEGLLGGYVLHLLP